MTKSNITEYDNTAANNTDVQDVPLGESAMFPSHVNNAFREIMADLADINDGTVAMTSPSFASASVTGNFTVDTDTLHVDSTNNRVGIGTTSPADSQLDVRGTAGVKIGDGTCTLELLGRDDLGYAIIGTDTNHPIAIRTNNTERMRIDGSGNVGIGTSSPSQTLELNGTGSRIYITDGNEDISMTSTGDGQLSLKGNGYTGAVAIDGTGMHVYHNSASRSLILGTNETCRFEIDGTGRIGIGSQGSIQTNGQFGIYNISYARYPIFSASSNSLTPFMLLFQNASHTTIGSIRMSGTTGVSYNTSSDYRLKENVTDLTDGITRVKQLQPKRFNFIDDPDRTVDGFLAHEVTAVPEAISGDKDEVDDEGNPVYQGIDQSKLVPLLTAALQEAITKIETLEIKVAALETE
ncbi:MAG: hypothetical protein Unbinned3459contig1002_48 [Prokaryotic dsDNA virus sp.]|jgi:hypothetical protein|nr:MAG: hypothetical protein Unbinned3459contig1002_48 [Prokaryotic dsDNA virus sp.]